MNHRLLEHFEHYELPRPAAPQVTAAGFMACPAIFGVGLSMAQQQWQLALYQLALEQAQAMATPSLPERDLCGVWN